MTYAPPRQGYADVGDAAEFLNCSVRTIWRLVASGELPARRIGTRMVRFRWSDLDQVGEPRPAGNTPTAG